MSELIAAIACGFILGYAIVKFEKRFAKRYAGGQLVIYDNDGVSMNIDLSITLKNAAIKFADEQALTGNKRSATIITRGKKCRVRFMNKASERAWLEHCAQHEIPNSAELNY